MEKLKKILFFSAFSFLALILVGCSCQNNKTFTVTFDSNGGSEVEKQEVKANEKVEEPTDPTKDGYTFKGWYLSGKKYDFDKKVTKDIKLKARWTKLEESNEVDEDVIYTPIFTTPVVNTNPVVNEPVVTKKNATLSIQSEATVYVNQVARFVVSAVANDDANTMVVGTATISDLEALEKLEYLGKDEIWYEISIEDVYGEEGFALVNASCTFRATFNKAGDYEVTVQLLDVITNEVVAETTQTITVNQKDLTDIIAEKDELLTTLAEQANEVANEYGFESVEYDSETKKATLIINNPSFSLLQFKDERILELVMENLDGMVKANYELNGQDEETDLSNITEEEITELALEVFEALTEGKEENLSALANETFEIDITYLSNNEEETVTYTIEFIYEEDEENPEVNPGDTPSQDPEGNPEVNPGDTPGQNPDENPEEEEPTVESATEIQKDITIGQMILSLNETANDYGFESITYNTTTNVMKFTVSDPEASLIDYADSGFIDLIKTSFAGAEYATAIVNGEEVYIDLIDVPDHKIMSFGFKVVRKLSGGNGYSLGAVANKSILMNVEFMENGELIIIPYTISFVMNA